MDNAKEFVGADMAELCDNIEDFCIQNNITWDGVGIEREFTAPYTPEQNPDENYNGTLKGAARAIMLRSQNSDRD